MKASERSLIRLRSAAHSILEVAGLQVRPSLRQRLDSLSRRGLRVRTTWDVGAHDGQWTSWARNIKALRNSNFVLFEANEHHEEKLRSLEETYFLVVLAGEMSRVPFYTLGGTGDSLYRETSANYAGVEPKLVSTTTLDRVRQENALDFPDFIKLDTQGSEKDIIHGARESLVNLKVALCEISVGDFNEGAPNLPEMFEVFRNLGLRPIGVIEEHRHQGILVQIDVLFVHSMFL